MKQEWMVLTKKNFSKEQWNASNKEQYLLHSYIYNNKKMKIWMFLEYLWIVKLYKIGLFLMYS
jgi:hypothetical protein